ncbi:hypothetical protein DAPPUDRAFT_107267 [Daphnia pulex]|uniref:CCHC-type domain-containing protein n=1 Tax=Daphnia pulex TaxID=6669 RepID=E9GWJ9_DAPPU|nr:hypothetical protein DAPPUDRAFT_107267 [Daphnia pulex]|eukprot:EFX76173.1 hypothetical protein DAPPUDRAFT_107267 [Daphnia pulex]
MDNNENYDVEAILDIEYVQKAIHGTFSSGLGYEEATWNFYKDVGEVCIDLMRKFMEDFQKSNRAPVELMITHPFTKEPEDSDEDTATKHHLYSESNNEEGAEFEACEYVFEYSSCQQSSPAPSFQIHESGSAEFSEEEPIQRQQFLGPFVSPSYGQYPPEAEEKNKKSVRCINCHKRGHVIKNCPEPIKKKKKKKAHH